MRGFFYELNLLYADYHITCFLQYLHDVCLVLSFKTGGMAIMESNYAELVYRFV